MNDDLSWIRLAILQYPNITDQIWEKLATDSSNDIQESLLTSMKTPKKFRDYVLQNASETLLCSVVPTIKILSVMSYVADCGTIATKKSLLRNPSIPFATVEKLYEEGCFSKEVRQWKQNTIKTNSLSKELLEKLAVDKDLFVRKTLARKIPLPDSVLFILNQDTHPSIQKLLQKRKENI